MGGLAEWEGADAVGGVELLDGGADAALDGGVSEVGAGAGAAGGVGLEEDEVFPGDDEGGVPAVSADEVNGPAVEFCGVVLEGDDAAVYGGDEVDEEVSLLIADDDVLAEEGGGGCGWGG